MTSSPGSSESSWGTWSSDASQLVTVDMTRSQLLGLGISPPPQLIPRLVVRLQPELRFRYRYDTEMSGTHGSLQAQRDCREKGVPMVELEGYSGPAVIRVSLATCNEGEDKFPHPHHLFVKEKFYVKRYINLDKKEVYKTGHYMDPHYIVLKEDQTARFEGMCIINSKKEQFPAVIREKMMLRGMEDGPHLDILVEEALRHVDIAFVSLCFEAFRFEDGTLKEALCPPVYSNPIANAKNASTGKLKITKINKCSGSCRGGDSIWLLVEKINKKGLVVRFFEHGPDGRVVWEADVEGDKLELHHQYAIIFNTPPYKDPDISRDVTVSMRLERRTVPFDYSEAETFVYVPCSTRQNRTENLYRKESMFMSSGGPNKRPMSDLIQPYDIPSKRKADEFLFCESLPPLPNDFNSKEFELLIQQLSQELPMKNVENPNDLFSLRHEDFFQPFSNCFIETDGPGDNSRKTIALMRLLIQVLVAKSQLKDKDLKNITERISRLFLKPDDYRLQDAASTLLSLRTNALSKKSVQDAVTTMDQSEELSSGEVECDDTSSNEKEVIELHLAIEDKNCEKLETLLRQNKKDDWLLAKNKQGMTALQLAVSCKKSLAVQKLLAAGANPNIEDKNTGGTCLHLAVTTECAEVVRSLLEHPKMDSSHKDKNGMTASQMCFKLFPDLSNLFTKREVATERCLQKVANIFNLTGKWKNLAELMDLASFMHEAEGSINPTMWLFNDIEGKEGLDLEMLRNLVDVLEERECVSIIDETLAKKYL